MSNRKMRVAILAHSFSGAYRIFREIQDLEHIDVSIVLSPSPSRSPVSSVAVNVLRAFLDSLRNFSIDALQLLAKGKLVFLTKQLDHKSSTSKLNQLDFDIGLHKTGVIYRSQTIAAFRLGILNPHIGLLPQYRGRSVMEWSLLQGDPVGITVFFIDEGIDTGRRIVFAEEVDITNCGSVTEAKTYLFNLDALFFRKALVLLASNNPLLSNNGTGRRYYVMSKLFTGAVDELLKTHHR
ncbi:MAG TPA: formyltransferase family protein [Pyrinomonadaceae bacterium]|nr:formyltransferase family protein [Pyrinomonadaceae bacterium]